MTARATIHMAATLDGIIARRDDSVDWLETADELEDGATMDPEFVTEILKTIDRYVMGGAVSGECLRRGLAGVVRYSTGMDPLRHEVRKLKAWDLPGESSDAFRVASGKPD